MTYYAYLFASRSIQNYIFAGGKLRDVVAGSNLLDQLTGGILEDVLDNLDINQSIGFSRRAGGAFYALSKNRDAIQKLASLWPLVVSGMLPGLDVVMTQASGDNEYDAVKTGLKKLDSLKNFPVPQFPLVPPVAQRAQRTGEGAIVDWNRSKASDIPKGMTEVISKSTYNKRLFARQGVSVQRKGVRRELREKFSVTSTNDLYWPKALSEEEGLEPKEYLPLVKNSYVAVVHIDGNGLGQLLVQLNQVAKTFGEHYSDVYLGVSKAIAETTEHAAAQAMEEVILPAARAHNAIVPAVPLVLGGDDITVIVVAEYALAFTQAYIKAFEHLSTQRLHKLKAEFPKLNHICDALPERLTASAGVAFCKATYPFQYASDLAENLCKKAKTMAVAAQPGGSDKNAAQNPTTDKGDSVYQAPPAAICWHKITTTSIASVKDIFEGELTYEKVQHSTGKQASHQLSLGAYALGEQASTLPSFEAFIALQKDVLGDVNQSASAEAGNQLHGTPSNNRSSRLGRLREYMGYLKTNPYQAEQILERLWEVDPQFMTRFREHLEKIWPAESCNDEFAYETGAGSMSLLADLIASASVMKDSQGQNSKKAVNPTGAQ